MSPHKPINWVMLTQHFVTCLAPPVDRDARSLDVLVGVSHSLHQQFPAFGGGVRLCKRWVSSHLFSNHLADEAVELMVAYLFISPAPYTIPRWAVYEDSSGQFEMSSLSFPLSISFSPLPPTSTDMAVFVRFISLLTTFSWEEEPLVVNFNKEFSGEFSDAAYRDCIQ